MEKYNFFILTVHVHWFLVTLLLLPFLQVTAAYQSGMIFSVIDSRMGSYPSECVEKFVSLALKCCQEETDARPSVAEMVRELENIWRMMPDSNPKTETEKDSYAASKPKTSISSSSSSSAIKNPYVSSDASGSDLVSGIVPTIMPR